ncbi:MAG TPA: CopG family transcriptional regulator [Solirubrobacterales bacterium]|nr:CopG family transcriptional regulator [Solirubrobacterales bacterium]
MATLAAPTYGTMYGVKRTTIYLTDAQKRELELLSSRITRTESDLIREGVDHVLDAHRPRVRKPAALFALGDPLLDDPNRVDEALEGFGEA